MRGRKEVTEVVATLYDMSEADWLACRRLVPLSLYVYSRFSWRLRTLLAVACGQQIWDLLVDERSRSALTICAQAADGAATMAQVDEARLAASQMPAAIELPGALQAAQAAVSVTEVCLDVSGDRHYALTYSTRNVAEAAAKHTDWYEVRGLQVALLHDIFSNPFRSIVVDPAWSNTTVSRLAEAIYTDRAFDRLPIVADALEDAGCTHPDILEHCRGPGPHVLGCWVVDLLLGKE